VWVGNSDNSTMERMPGSVGAAPIWHEFMQKALAKLPVENFVEPPGLVRVEVCTASGLLPTDKCPDRRTELFIKGNEPKAHDNVYQTFRLHVPTGKLATVYSPPEEVEERVFEIFLPEAADWVRENNIPQPPREYDDTFGPNPVTTEVAIINPKPYGYVRGVVPIQGNARGGNFQMYRLQYGEGLDPSAWIQIGPDHHNAVDRGVLEVWDTSQLDGLYTLQLLVLDHGGGVRRYAQQVTVDNAPPAVKMKHPWDGKEYIMEDDEWVSIQAEVKDNAAMDRVEYFLDDKLYKFSTVPPFNVKWTIVMSDVNPTNAGAIAASLAITGVTISEIPGGYTIQFANGWGVIRNSGGYTETHEIRAIAFDKAGNQADSDRVRIFIGHKKK